MRTPDELLASSLMVINKAFALSPRVKYFGVMFPLFSGGYDSLCACYVASQHPKFGGAVYHIDTGIGSKGTRKYVDETCEEFGWRLVVKKSNFTYEKFIRRCGFPAPGAHQWIYNKIKDRCVDQLTKGRPHNLLITGCRSVESTRRMGHVDPIQVGELSKTTGELNKRSRIWTAPCHDWIDEEQREFVQYHGFPRNPVKDSILGMSGECFCGAFARPSEREMLKLVCPDVDAEITRLEVIAKECGIEERNQTWGYRGKDQGRKPIEVAETGPMCSSCDRHASAAGIVVKSCSTLTSEVSNGTPDQDPDRPPDPGTTDATHSTSECE